MLYCVIMFWILKHYIWLEQPKTGWLVAQSTCFSTTQELTGQGAKHKVFVDTDNLTDLTRLFTVVSNEVDAKLLVLSSCFCCFSHGKSAIQYHLRESIGHIHITIYIFIDLVLFGSDIFSSKSKGYVGHCWHIISAHAEMVPGWNYDCESEQCANGDSGIGRLWAAKTLLLRYAFGPCEYFWFGQLWNQHRGLEGHHKLAENGEVLSLGGLQSVSFAVNCGRAKGSETSTQSCSRLDRLDRLGLFDSVRSFKHRGYGNCLYFSSYDLSADHAYSTNSTESRGERREAASNYSQAWCKWCNFLFAGLYAPLLFIPSKWPTGYFKRTAWTAECCQSLAARILNCPV